jgi:hypothetical protein
MLNVPLAVQITLPTRIPFVKIFTIVPAGQVPETVTGLELKLCPVFGLVIITSPRGLGGGTTAFIVIYVLQVVAPPPPQVSAWAEKLKLVSSTPIAITKNTRRPYDVSR